MQDEEFQFAQAELKMKIQTQIAEFRTLKQQLEVYTVLQNKCVAYMQMILEFPTIFDAFNDPQVSSIAHSIFVYWRSQGIRRIEYFDACYCDQLQMLGFAVSEAESNDLAIKELTLNSTTMDIGGALGPRSSRGYRCTTGGLSEPEKL